MDLLHDLRYAFRLLTRRPGFILIVAATLALGIGATTAVFSIVDAVLLRPLPYREPDKLVQVLSSQVPRTGPSKLFNSYSDFEYWQSHNKSFEQLEAYTWVRPAQTVIINGQAEKVLAIPTSAGFFSMLGVAAAEGRTFEGEDLGRGPAVVLSHGFWKSRLGGSSIVGNALMLGGQPARVVGIMPETFDFYPKQTELWTLIGPESEFVKKPLNSLVIAYGRLRNGVSIEQAQAELALLHQQVIDRQPPDSWLAHIEPSINSLQSDMTWLAGRNLKTGLLVMFAAVGFVLLIACVNVANLLLGRSAEREKEFAIRAALGCERGRLVRQLLTESLMLSSIGAVPGIVIASLAVYYFRTAPPIELPPGNLVSINLRVLVFTIVLTATVGILFGLVPALKISKLSLNDVLKATSRGTVSGGRSHRLGGALVIAEVTLSLVLLTGAGLLIQSLVKLGSSPLGFRVDHLLTARIELPSESYVDQSARNDYYDSLLARLGNAAGVEGAALTSGAPLAGPGNRALSIEGQPDAQTGGIGDVGAEVVSGDYFGVMNISLLRGRVFDARDRATTQPVTVISEALASEYFPNEDPIGKHIRLADKDPAKPWLTVIGIVADIKRTTVYKEMEFVVGPFLYQPITQAVPSSMTIFLRTAGRPSEFASQLRQEVLELNSEVPASDILTMDDRLAEFLSSARFRAQLFGWFAGFALLLAMIGIYGVLSQSVTQRKQEIGVRIALGAQPGDVLSLVLRKGLVLALTGIAIGAALSLLLGRLIASMLYGVHASDPVTLSINACLLVLAAILACYLPARRATRVDPMTVLRSE